MKLKISKLTILLGSASLLTLFNALTAQGQQQTAQTQTAEQQLPEQVLITGSLIHGAAAVGVPVTQVGPQDFTESASLSIGDYLRYIPAINVPNSVNAPASPGGIERGTYVSIHGEGGAREELLINGMRFPLQTSSASAVDPSVVPELAVDHVDVLADGASAIYGSDLRRRRGANPLRHGRESPGRRQHRLSGNSAVWPEMGQRRHHTQLFLQ